MRAGSLQTGTCMAATLPNELGARYQLRTYHSVWLVFCFQWPSSVFGSHLKAIGVSKIEQSDEIRNDHMTNPPEPPCLWIAY